MAFEKKSHSLLVEQLKGLTAKKAENPSEAKLTTDHPTGSDSTADDGTSPAVVGSRYSENTEDSKTMYPAGTSSDNNADADQTEDPGHNKNIKVRPSGENVPEYELENPHDPGTSHPVGKAAADLRKSAAALAAIFKQMAKKSDEYVSESGDIPEKAKDDKPKDAKGTGELDPGVAPVSSENMEGGKTATYKELAQLKMAAAAEYLKIANHMKSAGVNDADAFIQTIGAIAGGVASVNVKQAAAVNPEVHLHVIADHIQAYDKIASAVGAPSFYSIYMDGVKSAKKVKRAAEDEEAAEDKSDGEDEESDKDEPKSKSKEKADSAPSEDGEGEAPAADTGSGSPADAILGQMAATPAAPDASALAGAGGGGAPAQLTPEEEQLLMQLMQAEGMKQADIVEYTDFCKKLASKKIQPTQISPQKQTYITECDKAVKAAGAKFHQIKASKSISSHLNQIYKGFR